ncbi:MAG TPA: hypothetical protein DD422_05815 [Akkermansia sp.]|nr:hypothetical protein [Akkermansia sp.]
MCHRPFHDATTFPSFSIPQSTVPFLKIYFPEKRKMNFFLKSSYKHLDFPEEKSIFLSPLTR